LHISKLKLTNFKNYSFADISFSSGYNLITGKNGEGKTNLLDAIYFLCMTKSYFHYSEKNVVKLDANFFRIEGHFEDSNESKVVCKYRLDGGKVFEVNDKEIGRYSHYIGTFPVVMIAPNDIHLIEEGSEERRKFIDTSICQVDMHYLQALNAYNKLLKQRNSILRQINRNQSGQYDLVDYYTQQMATLCVDIIAKRAEFTTQVSAGFDRIYDTITESREVAGCNYFPNVKGTEVEIISEFKAALRKDLILERTTRGIHRDDLEFLLHGEPVKRIGSQGQIKSAIFAAKLAQYQWLSEKKAELPILLLDDIFDKLDHDRVGKVLQLIDTADYGQIFITDTYADRNREILSYLHKPVSQYQVEAGGIHVRT